MNTIIKNLRKLTERARMGFAFKSNLGDRFTSYNGISYRFDSQGVCHRLDRKPWTCKADRKRFLRDRRDDRAMAAANLAHSLTH
jgi:hypothetical protein